MQTITSLIRPIFSILLCFVATVSFCILFKVPKKQLLFCGLAGVVSWLVYYILVELTGDSILATFFGAVATTIVCNLLAKRRKTPITIFLIAGLIPLVPGSVIYKSMYYTVMNNNIAALNEGIYTIKLAGVIAVGIGIILFSKK